VDFSFNFRGTTDTDTAGGTLQLTNEAQLWGRTNRLVVGGEYQSSDVKPASTSAAFGFISSSSLEIDETDAAFFAQETFDLTPEITLTGAVRYDSTSITFQDLLVPANNGSQWFGRWTPRAGVTYTPWPILSSISTTGRIPRSPRTTCSRFPELEPEPEAGHEPDLRVGVRARPLGGLICAAICS
jgi:outer membrane receptor protein involved in Fe transport